MTGSNQLTLLVVGLVGQFGVKRLTLWISTNKTGNVDALAVGAAFCKCQLASLWRTGQLHRRTLRPRQILLTSLELHLPRGMHLDVSALDLQVSPLCRGEQMPLCARRQAGVGAGDGDFLVGGGG